MAMSYPERNKWLAMSDAELSVLCKMQAFKSSGPGGQKVNKTSSAVRLIHNPTGIEVTSSESRSQHENRHHGLKKMRMKIALEIRSNEKKGIDNFEISVSNPKYPLFAALLLDSLNDYGFRISDCAQFLGLSTGQFVRLLEKDPEIWRKVNSER
ncbi:MAG: peptide chain release factor-like protein, partial [Lentisphaerae bacterium]|nr:peptide chain release factor-like protein [Lentisphaerota bacterium]